MQPKRAACAKFRPAPVASAVNAALQREKQTGGFVRRSEVPCGKVSSLSGRVPSRAGQTVMSTRELEARNRRANERPLVGSFKSWAARHYHALPSLLIDSLVCAAVRYISPHQFRALPVNSIHEVCVLRRLMTDERRCDPSFPAAGLHAPDARPHREK